jgi:rhamnosyltransferase
MVDILMATYNGEAFVEEQVQSIINQTYREWRLLVHDDGSTDKTMEILHRLAEKDERVVVIEDGVQRLGVARHFIHLVKQSTAAYCMFCDQDDVWLPHKVEKMVHAIEQYNQGIPQVVYTNAFLWSPDRGIISDKNTLTYPTTLRQTLFLNTGIQGAAAIFNRAMCKVIEQPLSYYAMHDHVLLLAGICFGEVHYLHESLMYYRQHEHNVTGNAPGSIAKKIALMWENRGVRLVNREHYEGLKAFYERFEAQMKGDDKQVIEAFLAMTARNGLARMRCAIEYRFKLFDSVTLLLIKMILRKYM